VQTKSGGCGAEHSAAERLRECSRFGFHDELDTENGPAAGR